jgi:dynein heavy chain
MTSITALAHLNAAIVYVMDVSSQCMKNILRNAGAKNNNTVFLLADTQIKMESFVEDINNLLNVGEIPNL